MEQNIVTLDYLEGLNRRFSMYLGVEPIQQCVKEIISNSLDEAKLGLATCIRCLERKEK